MKALIKNKKLPPAPEPTKAYCSRVVVGDISRHLTVVDVDGYKPKPSPIPRKRVEKKRKKQLNPARAGMYPRSEWTEERTQKLIEMVDAGRNYHEIGHELKCSADDVGVMIMRLRKQGLAAPSKLRFGWTAEQDEELLRMVAEGKTYKAISAVIGKAPSACWNRVQKLEGGR